MAFNRLYDEDLKKKVTVVLLIRIKKHDFCSWSKDSYRIKFSANNVDT